MGGRYSDSGRDGYHIYIQMYMHILLYWDKIDGGT